MDIELKKQLKDYKKDIAQNPDDEGIYNNMGIVYGKLGEYDQAIECFRKALSINPQLAAAYANIGFAYAHLEDYDHALAYYRKAIAIEPDCEHTLYNIGVAYMEKNDYRKAIKHFRQALKLKPDANACNSLGNAYACAGMFPTAVKYFERAIALDPELVYAYENLGQACEIRGDGEKARCYYQKAADLGSEDAQKWLNENKYSKFIPLKLTNENDILNVKGREVYMLKFNVLENKGGRRVHFFSMN
jgi:superkiller protein 3